MKKLIPIGAGVVLALTLFAPSAALADDTAAPPDATLSVESPATGMQTPAEAEAPATEALAVAVETVWQAWIMPEADWPQAVASEANLALVPCGTTVRIQNDEYLPAERDRFIADGVLTYGEDFQSDTQRGAISWYYTEYSSPACAPTEVTPVTPTVTPGVGSCVEGEWTETPSVLTFTPADNVRYSTDGINFSADPGPIQLTTSELTVSAITSEGNFVITQPEGWTRFDAGTVQYTATPVALTPEDCAVVVNPPDDDTEEVTASGQRVALAATGVEDVLPWLAAGLTLALTGVLAVIASMIYRRRQSETE